MRYWVIVAIHVLVILLLLFIAKPAHSLVAFIIDEVKYVPGVGIEMSRFTDTGSEEKNKVAPRIKCRITRQESDALKWYFDADDCSELSGRTICGQTFEEAFERISHYREHLTPDQELAILFAGRIKRHISSKMPKGMELRKIDFSAVKERLDIICNNKEQFKEIDVSAFPSAPPGSAAFEYSYFTNHYKVLVQYDPSTPLVFL